MKILLVGAFQFGSTDCWKKLALERLGHRVVPWPYRERSVRECFVQGDPFDLVFVSKGVPMSADDFAHLATLGRARLLWWPDPFENWGAAQTEALRTGAWSVSATSSVVLDRILGAVLPRTAPERALDYDTDPLTFVRRTRILEGCDCEGPRPEWMPSRVEPALLHFGSMTPRREAVIARLRDAGVSVRVLERPLYGAALQREVLKHAAVLGINTSPDLYSNRVQTVLAMGGVILQEDAPELRQDFATCAGLFRWVSHEDLLDHSRFLIEHGKWAASVDDARCLVFDRFRWERVMSRAIDFAVGAAA